MRTEFTEDPATLAWRLFRRVFFCRRGYHDLVAVDMDGDWNPWEPGVPFEFVFCRHCTFWLPFIPFDEHDE